MVNAFNKTEQMCTEDLDISCTFYLKRGKGWYIDIYNLL